MYRMSHAHHTARPDAEPTVSVELLRDLIAPLTKRGAAAGKLLSAVELTPSDLDDVNARFSLSKLYRLWEHAIAETGDPALGLRPWNTQPTSALISVSYLVANASTLRQALFNLVHYTPLLTDCQSVEVTEQNGAVTVAYLGLPGAGPSAQRYSSERFVVGMLRIAEWFGVPASDVRVSFGYPAPAYHAQYTSLFGGAERFEQPFTGVTLDVALLDACSPSSDQEVWVAMQRIAERRIMSRAQRISCADRVREQVRCRGATVSMKRVAQTLELSTRSLARQLEAEGVRFKDLVTETRMLLAKHLVGETGRSIQEVAFDMGYADSSTFHRAFKRWTGMTPQDFRKQSLDARGGAQCSTHSKSSPTK
jgi:AraC-like DNA-binding protein